MVTVHALMSRAPIVQYGIIMQQHSRAIEGSGVALTQVFGHHQ